MVLCSVLFQFSIYFLPFPVESGGRKVGENKALTFKKAR